MVTDGMVSAAISAHSRNEIEGWNAEGWKPSDSMRAAITAALEASGELERLRAALKAAEDKQCASCRHCDSFGLRAVLEGGVG